MLKVGPPLTASRPKLGSIPSAKLLPLPTAKVALPFFLILLNVTLTVPDRSCEPALFAAFTLLATMELLIVGVPAARRPLLALPWVELPTIVMLVSVVALPV